jgi:AcrR family transcriptional regulator
MPRSAETTRRRILDAAYELFYRKGFSRVGIDEVAVFAKVTKRTLYYHFTSKDDLLAAVLDFHSSLALARIRKYENRYVGSPAEIVTLLFSELARWSTKPGWSPAGFTRIAMELADLPGHPARAIARRHKAAMEAWCVDILTGAGVAEPGARAREVVLLLEGAMAMILIHGERGYAEAGAEAARRLLETASTSRAPRRAARSQSEVPTKRSRA